MTLVGILFAVGALIAWGFGDFFIQRATREIGIWKSLFFICLTAVVVLLPFIQSEIGEVLNNSKGLVFLLMAGVAIFAAALLIFESMKVGKLAIVEPILSLELPVAVALGVFLAHESLNMVQLILIGVVFIGVVLAMTKHHTHLHYHKRIFERGVLYAFFGALIMGTTNFLIGVSSQETSALLTIWFTGLMIAVFCFVYFVIKGRVKSLVGDLKKHIKTITSSSVFDNAAWISYAFATTYIPISIATTISESYIALAVGLGILVNKEKVNWHQVVGIALAVSGVILLSLVTG
ncbi:MAG: DMT family transporter [bacterium]|nr:DMT family transporter [bacterium]